MSATDGAITTLTDTRVVQLLQNRQTLAELPEFQHVIAHYHATQAANPRGGCSGCAGRRQKASAVRAAHQLLLSLKPDRLDVAKRLMGLSGRIRIYDRVGSRLVPKVI